MAITKIELKNSFLQDILQSEETQAKIKQYQDLLTGQSQLAKQQYHATAQTAAEQASYDISGAYANYLKQQRSIAAQGRLESGYKEEVGDVLQQQYQSAYGQAKATQAETTAAAQAQYVKNLTAYEQAAEKAKTQIFEAAQKKAGIQANLYRAAEDYSKLAESEYTVYDENAKLTSWGKELVRKGLLENADEFETYLEEQGMTEELEYYYTNPQAVREELFDITESDYGISEQSIAATKHARIETGDILKDRPMVSSTGSLSEDQTNLKGSMTSFANKLGLSADDIKKVLGGTINDFINEFGLDTDDYQTQADLMSEAFVEYSRYKQGLVGDYITLDKYDWQRRKSGKGGRSHFKK